MIYICKNVYTYIDKKLDRWMHRKKDRQIGETERKIDRYIYRLSERQIDRQTESRGIF